MNDNLARLLGMGMFLVFLLLVAIILAPSRACPDDFYGKGDVVYFWPGRMILPPESSVAEWKEEESELATDPAPQCIPENESCEFPAEE